MIVDSKILIVGHSRNLKHYRDLGYELNVGDNIFVKPEHLMRGSTTIINSQCDNCGSYTKNTFKDYWNYTDGLVNPYYCNKCKYIKSEVTCIDKYGVSNPMKDADILEKLRNNLFKKYGVSWYSKTDEWLEKYKLTSNENWGVDNPSKSPVIIDKIKMMNNQRYGVDWVMQNSDVRAKSILSYRKNWGAEHISKTEYFHEKIRQTSMSNWGVDHYSKTDEYKIRVINTNLREYGGSPMATDRFKEISKLTKERKTFRKYSQLISDDYEFVSYKDGIFNIIHKKCGSSISISKSLLVSRLSLSKTICTVCNPIGVHNSNFEMGVYDFICGLGVHCVKNDKTILGGKQEIDIYIPDFKLAIECNGLFWHSEYFKSKNYHLDKTLKCRELGISLIHIWEDDWENRRDIIKSIILYKLNIVANILYARKCVINEVGTVQYKKFLEDNHVQGYSSSSYNYGLYYNDELVSLMTFGWRRTNGKREFELIRFCNKINHVVVGSASRLFKHAMRVLNIDEVISYSDISIFGGDIYKKLGFSYVRTSTPNYFWVVNGKRRHRYNFSKRKLVNRGYDVNKTADEIMYGLGHYRVFSCGQEKWVYNKKTAL